VEEGGVARASLSNSHSAATVKAIQRKQIGYADFLRQIMKAGCASCRA